MATDPSTVAYILDQCAGAGGVSARKMFGEYALYRVAKVVALICDDQLFLKPTAQARALVPDLPEGAPYPGAKPHLLVSEALDDADLMARLVLAVDADLPEPKPKKPSAGRG